MNRSTAIVVLLAASSLARPATANFVCFDADFEEHPGGPIQYRGAAFEEPTPGVNDATGVGVTGFGGTALVNIPDQSAGTQVVHWRFLREQIVDNGRLHLSCRLKMNSRSNYTFEITGADTQVETFMGLAFDDEGCIVRYDGNTSEVAGSYSAFDRVLEVVLDLDAGTYSLWFDGVPVVIDDPYGLSGAGVAEFNVGHLPDPDTGVDSISIDDIWIYHEPSSGPALLLADFDGEPVDQTIGTGGAAVGQPIAIVATPTVRDDGAFPTSYLEFGGASGAEGATFRFLNEPTLSSGTVCVALDLFFSDHLGFTVELRSDLGINPQLLRILFEDDGTFAFHDAGVGVPYTASYESRVPIEVRVSALLDLELLYVWVDSELVLARHDAQHWQLGLLRLSKSSANPAPRLVDTIIVRHVDDPAVSVPAATSNAPVALHAPRPQPFATDARLRFSLARAGHVRLDLFDPSGRRVATLAEGTRAAGDHHVSWNGRDGYGRLAPSGVYYVSLASGGTRELQRLVLVR